MHARREDKLKRQDQAATEVLSWRKLFFLRGNVRIFHSLEKRYACFILDAVQPLILPKNSSMSSNDIDIV